MKKYYECLFRINEGICISDSKFGTAVATYTELPPKVAFVCINPLHVSLDLAVSKPTHSEGVGRRADANVSAFRNILCEFDTGTIEDQLKYISDSKVPYSTLVFSGKKSVHMVISLKTELLNDAEYRRLVDRVYNKLQGVDKSGRNPSRFTRAPGAMRDGVEQRLIEVRGPVVNAELLSWLGPEAPKEELMYDSAYAGSKLLKGHTLAFLMMGAPAGEWNSSLFKAAADMCRAGLSEEEICNKVMQITGLLDSKDRSTIKSAYQNQRRVQSV